jgi:hypothetical protein
MGILRNFAIAAFISVACPDSCVAQSTLNQKISGQVVDASGAALPGVAIIVVDQDTGFSRQTRTNNRGNYLMPDLATGKYRVTCDAPGFKKEVASDNLLTVDAGIEVNFKLQVGRQSESIIIKPDAAQLEDSNGELGYSITGEQASELPLNGRNYPELLALLPGVSTNYSSAFGLLEGYGVSNTGQSVNGGRTDSTTWNLNGADNKDNGGGNNFININPYAIGEVRVLSSNFSAQYGTSSGAVINASIRSGTKDLHASLYDFWRSDELAAAGYNAAVVGKPELRWSNFGGTFGGPVVLPMMHFNGDRNKLFFFVAEDLKVLRQGVTSTWTVPTALQKTGNFGASVIKNPATQVPYPNNVIPASQIDPNMQKLVNIFPNPNSGTASYIFNESIPTDVHQEVVQLDYNYDPKNQLSAHWTHDQFQQLENTTALIEYWRRISGLNSSIQWNRIFSPTFINVAQFAYTGSVVVQQNDIIPNTNFVPSITRTGLGLTEPTIYNASPDIPQVAISGYTTLSATPLNYNNYNRIFDLKDDVTKAIGNHVLRAGILIMRSHKNQDNPPAINGQYTFSTSRSPTSGQALADALLGDFQQYTESPNVRQGWYRFTQIEPYLQDDWKVNGRLTLNMGLRWSYMQPMYSALNNTVQFLPQYYSAAQASTISPSTGAVLTAPNPYNGLVLSGSGFPASAMGRVPQDGTAAVDALFHNLPLGGAYTRWGNLAPRFGFAFDPTGHQNTVIRGGFGISYERIQGNYLFSAINNTPFDPAVLVLNGVVSNPGAAAAGPVSVQTITNSHYLDMKDPRTLTYSLGVQRRLAHNMVATLTYVGSGAANLSYQQDINQLPLGRGNSVYVPGSKTVLANANSLRPYLGYGNIYEFNTGANFVYNSLQSQFRKTFAGGGIVSVGYTWSKGRTDANSYNYQPENSYNLRGDWGNSSYNRNQVLVASYVYTIPLWRQGDAWYKRAFGGWQTNGTVQIQSGLPINITIATDQAGTGDGNQRPNLIGNPYSGGNIGGSQILNPQAFAVPALNTFGNLGAYNVFLPNWYNWNGSLVKSWYLHERLKLDVRLEMYNVLNHLSISAVNTGSFNGVKTVNGAVVSNTGNWGAESGTTDPRNLQASMRLSF